MDRDETAIGGLKNPLQPTRQLFYTSVIMDLTALIASLYISLFFALGILLYILASRSYSYRGIRLKKYPVIGFLTVFVFQGALIFFITSHGAEVGQSMNISILPCIISSLLIGALYPLTQVYQHKEDERDGVTTISMLLGKRGSFVFSAAFFLAATILMYVFFKNELNYFYLFMLILLPVVLFFLYWMLKVWRNETAADFRHSLRMNILSTFCTTAFFLTLIILKH